MQGRRKKNQRILHAERREDMHREQVLAQGEEYKRVLDNHLRQAVSTKDQQITEMTSRFNAEAAAKDMQIQKLEKMLLIQGEQMEHQRKQSDLMQSQLNRLLSSSPYAAPIVQAPTTTLPPATEVKTGNLSDLTSPTACEAAGIPPGLFSAHPGSVPFVGSATGWETNTGPQHPTNTPGATFYRLDEDERRSPITGERSQPSPNEVPPTEPDADNSYRFDRGFGSFGGGGNPPANHLRDRGEMGMVMTMVMVEDVPEEVRERVMIQESIGPTVVAHRQVGRVVIQMMGRR